MLVTGAPRPSARARDGVEVAWVEDEAGMADFVEVNAEAYATYGMPAEVLPELFDQASAMVDDPSAHVVVARRAGAAIATAMVFESDGVASLQWVGTVPTARTAGLGALVTTRTTNLAFERGASSCTLQASPMGEPVYRALGYETIYHYAEYAGWPRPPSRLTRYLVTQEAAHVGGLAGVLQAIVGDADEPHAHGDRRVPTVVDDAVEVVGDRPSRMATVARAPR